MITEQQLRAIRERLGFACSSPGSAEAIQFLKQDAPLLIKEAERLFSLTSQKESNHQGRHRRGKL